MFMTSSLLLLSAGVLSTPVFISDVTASREAGHLRVEVHGDGGIDPESARTVIDDGRLVIYLGGTHVRADNRSWSLEAGAGEIRAHRHKSETELVVPLVGNGCDGPVELTGTEDGITALVGCDGAVAATPRSSRALFTEKIATKPAVNVDKLKQLVELPQEPPSAPKAVLPIAAAGLAEAPPREVKPSPDGPRAPLPVVAAPAPRATVLAPRRAGPATDRVESALTLPAPSVAAPLPKPVASITPVAGISVGRETGSSASGSLRAVGVPAAFLALLAVAAYGFSRRRRGSLPRHIEILETTSLGPKRSLICARIGDETVILGSSEAGITLLRGGQGPAISTAIATMAATPAMQATTRLTMMSTTSASVGGAPAVGAPVHHEGSDASATVAIHFSELSGSTSELDQPLEEALADIPEPGSGDHRGGSAGSGSVRSTFRAIEGGLAGLFGKKGVDFGQDEPSDRFEDLLEDSVEDQELRRKLAAGMSARIR